MVEIHPLLHRLVDFLKLLLVVDMAQHLADLVLV
jgi:hypothetical protein